MPNILIIGEETKAQFFKSFWPESKYNVEISDGDLEEDFKEFDILFDLNFDDDTENFPVYAGLRDKIVVLSTVKMSLAEAAYTYPTKVRSKLYGINAIPHYLQSDIWEISTYRKHEWADIDSLIKAIDKKPMQVEDQVGMYRPRIDFLSMNEQIQLMTKVLAKGQHEELISKELQRLDDIGVTEIFETLMAIYEDTKLMHYLPDPLLKTKYLRDHTFVNKKDA